MFIELCFAFLDSAYYHPRRSFSAWRNSADLRRQISVDEGFDVRVRVSCRLKYNQSCRHYATHTSSLFEI